MATQILNMVGDGDWQASWLFRMDILTAPTNLIVPDLTFKVSGATIPGSKVSVKEKKWGGQKVQYAGTIDSAGTFTCKIEMAEGMQAYKFFDDWHQRSGSDYSGVRLPMLLNHGDIRLTLIGADKEDGTVAWDFLQCWISELSDLTLEKGSDDFLAVDATIAYNVKKRVDLVYTPTSA
jgi:hypothetical protein